MKRLPGINVSAAVLALGALFQIPLAGAMLLAASISPAQGAASGTAQPAWMHLFLYALCGFFLVLAGWGLATAMGVYKLRRWARYSILVISGGMALIGIMSLVSSLAMMAFRLPGNPGSADVHNAQAIFRIVIGVIALLYWLMAATGIAWLVYFNRKKVREAFAGAQMPVATTRRPFLVSLLAVLWMVGAAFCVGAAFVPVPALVLGLVLYGWQKTVFYLGFAALGLLAGVGLWRLAEWGRRLALAFLALGMVNTLVYLVRPSLLLEITAVMRRAMHVTQPPLPDNMQIMLYVISFAFSLAIMVSAMAMLHAYRGRFAEPEETEGKVIELPAQQPPASV